MTYEICCGSYEDALQASRGGAERIELNTALHLGGLTPTAASVKLTRENTSLKIISMVRPRAGGFHYTQAEKEQMFAVGRTAFGVWVTRFGIRIFECRCNH